MVASCFKLIGIGQQCCASLAQRGTSGWHLCCGEITVGTALHGICSVDAGAAGVGVVGATAVGSLTACVIANVGCV